MLARLQRLAVVSIALVALAWWAACWALGYRGAAVVGALVVLLGYTLVLVIEFVLLACVRRGDPTPPARPLQLFQAWFRECIVAAQVFGWRQPFRAVALADVPGRHGVRGIVFVHGYLCNRGLWNPWLQRCAEAGRPCIAVNLEPVFGELDAYGPTVDRAVAKLHGETGLAPLVVCHSMGGLVVRAWLQRTPGADACVHHVITIGTPHRGTWLALLSRTANALHMRPSCDWLGRLARSEPAGRAARFTCFYGHADNIVMPPIAAILPGAQSRHLSGTAHMAMAFHPEVMQEVWNCLDRAEETPRAPD